MACCAYSKIGKGKMRKAERSCSFSAVVIFYFLALMPMSRGFSLRDVMDVNEQDEEPLADYSNTLSNEKSTNEVYLAEKRAGNCPPWKPFQCPEGTCIPLKYLCDYNVDCAESGYDENKKMCTAALRPTVESTEEFINYQLNSHGDDYFVKLFGPKGANRMVGLGGASVVAVALTESPRLKDFSASVSLTPSEMEHLRRALKMISESDNAGLAAMDFKESEIESLQPLVEQLMDTGFLKTE